MKQVVLLSLIYVLAITLGYGQKRARIPAQNPKGNSPIRRVDFRNFTYPLNESVVRMFGKQSVRLIRGKFIARRKPETEGVALHKVFYGDLTGEGQEDAVVLMFAGTIDASMPEGSFASVYIYTMNNGQPQLLTIFDPENDAKSHYQNYHQDGTTLFYATVTNLINGSLVVESLAGTARCCIDYEVVMLFRWDGKRLVLAEKPQRKRMSQ